MKNCFTNAWEIFDIENLWQLCLKNSNNEITLRMKSRISDLIYTRHCIQSVDLFSSIKKSSKSVNKEIPIVSGNITSSRNNKENIRMSSLELSPKLSSANGNYCKHSILKCTNSQCQCPLYILLRKVYIWNKTWRYNKIMQQRNAYSGPGIRHNEYHYNWFYLRKVLFVG